MTYLDRHAWVFSDGSCVAGVHARGAPAGGRARYRPFKAGDVVTVRLDFVACEASWFVNLHSVDEATLVHTVPIDQGGELTPAIMLDEQGDQVSMQNVPSAERRRAEQLLQLSRELCTESVARSVAWLEPHPHPSMELKQAELAAALAGHLLQAARPPAVQTDPTRLSVAELCRAVALAEAARGAVPGRR